MLRLLTTALFPLLLITPTSLMACASAEESTAQRYDTVVANEDSRIELSAHDDVFVRCELPQDRAYFDLDSTALDARELAFISGVATCMKSGAMADSAILLTGYADLQGPEAYNTDLAIRRARVVAHQLRRHGIPAERIYIRAEGEKDALFREPGNRDFDRRVELSRVASL